MNTLTTTTSAIPTNVCFVPVVVVGGCKFKGRGYEVSSSERTSDFGWKHVPGGDGFYYWERNIVTTETVKIWVPETGRFGYANAAYVEADTSVTETERQLAFQKYVDSTIESTKAWCRSVKPEADEAEILRFARNVIRKQHPELREVLDTVIPPPADNRDLATEVAKTVAWAMTLRTQPCFMYGRMCRGGKRYPNKRYIDIAHKACTKRGLAAKPEFEKVFVAEIHKVGLD